MSPDRLRGLLYVLVGSSLWGLSGTAAQVLFQRHGVTPQGLVTMRVAGAGLLLLVIVRPPFPRAHWRPLLVFAVLGVAAVQYTYFAAIALTNVATATFLQYTAMPMIAAYEVVRGRAHLTRSRALALGAAIAGVSALAVGGPAGLAVVTLNPLGLLFGLLSGVTAAVYVLTSVPLVRGIGPWATTTWGFLIAAMPMALLAPPWAVRATGRPLEVALLVAFVVVFGTLIAFGLFLASLRHLPPTEAAITSTAEAVAAAGAALLVLGVALRPLQYAGGAGILVAVLVLQRGSSTPTAPPPPLPP